MLLFAIYLAVVVTFNGLLESNAQVLSPRLPEDKMEIVKIPYTEEEKDAYTKGIVTKWENAIIPYYIDCSLENNLDALLAINEAMKQWERKTCIRFIKRTNEKFFLRFIRDTHCWGDIGVVSKSTVSVGSSCEHEVVMAHEIGHAVGLIHEHNRQDRDAWVKVDWANIGHFKEAFEKSNITERLQVDYDYGSIMHYPWTSFSSNGGRTMRPRGQQNRKKIPFTKVSQSDVKITSLMYDCPETERKRELIRKEIFKHTGKFYRKYDCVDRDDRCKKWADAGSCSTNEAVRIQCKRSCGSPRCYKGCMSPICKEGRSRSKQQLNGNNNSTEQWPNRNYLGTGIRCRDKKWGCRSWGKQGECQRNPIWMNLNCLKSCPKSLCDRTNIQPPGKCSSPLGLSVDVRTNGFTLPDSAFTAKSYLSIGKWRAFPSFGRLYMDDYKWKNRIGAWCAADYYNPGYLQVDLQETKTIRYIATQGRANHFERISKFMIRYSNDDKSYMTYKENKKDKVFNGNCDHVTPIVNEFTNRISARYIRYVPVEWNWPCVRMELYGC